jgi:hypothetical protein
MRGASCFVAPIPDHTFFEQAQFEGLLGDDLLQLQGLALEILDLAARCGPRGVARKPSLARFEELFGPAVIQALGNAFAPAQLGDRVLAARPSKTMRIFSSAEN